MARSHVNNYYKAQIKSLLSMQETVKQMEQAYREGKISEENYSGFVQLTEALRVNVDRISYIVYLMNQPRFGIKKFFQKHKDKLDYFASHKADEAGVFAENNKVLDDMQKYIELMQEKDTCKTI